ncbi:hypothetical protein BJ508DRAFT_179335 [Ascobolus immersus RN42]|uniref:F-box domain-containing protein n=1 Tax=Ascobolus immersus RN42 TaxID=1160509 RepID=A0A3N4HYM5_ASCIM|nr:hypothetical protein BJ508DRAFT_179335 [Ascobolus immersus RN42]
MAGPFPPELVSLLLFELCQTLPRLWDGKSTSLKEYATVSRQWQYAAEQESGVFHTVAVRSNELDTFATVFGGHRRRFLRCLEYHIVLPKYARARCCLFETRKEQEKNNEAFTEAIQALFLLLKEWEARDVDQGPPLELNIKAHSPMDVGWRSAQDRYMVNLDYRDLQDRRWQHSFLRFSRVALGSLPILSRVTGFACNMGGTRSKDGEYRADNREFEGRSLVQLATKFPNLEAVGWIVEDDDLLYPWARKRRRQGFARALADNHGLWKKLKKFELRMQAGFHTYDTFHAPNLKEGDTARSSLTFALRHILHLPQLEAFELGSIVVGPSIFEAPPCNNNAPTSATFQPFSRLKILKMNISKLTPNGGYYFAPDPSQPPGTPEGDRYEDDYEDSESEEPAIELEDFIDKVIYEDSDPDMLTVEGKNPHGDTYPWPPRYGREYKVDWFRAIGHDQVLYHRFRIDTPESRSIFEGFLKVLKAAPGIQEARLQIGAGEHHKSAGASVSFVPVDEWVAECTDELEKMMWKMHTNEKTVDALAFFGQVKEWIDEIPGSDIRVEVSPKLLHELWPDIWPDRWRA